MPRTTATDLMAKARMRRRAIRSDIPADDWMRKRASTIIGLDTTARRWGGFSKQIQLDRKTIWTCMRTPMAIRLMGAMRLEWRPPLAISVTTREAALAVPLLVRQQFMMGNKQLFNHTSINL